MKYMLHDQEMGVEGMSPHSLPSLLSLPSGPLLGVAGVMWFSEQSCLGTEDVAGQANSHCVLTLKIHGTSAITCGVAVMMLLRDLQEQRSHSHWRLQGGRFFQALAQHRPFSPAPSPLLPIPCPALPVPQSGPQC